MNAPPSKTAVVLSGGGAYGAFAVGVLKGLCAGRSPGTGYRHLDADIFTGTSVGAFLAAVMASHPEESGYATAERLENIWLNRIASRPGGCGNGVFRIRGNVFDYTNPACYASPVSVFSQVAGDSARIGGYFLSRAANFAADDASMETRAVQLFNISSFIDATRFGELLEEVILPENIYANPKSLRIVATNWVTGKAEYFGNSAFSTGLGIQALRASTAIPGIFPPVQIGRDIYVDGGVVENTPLKPATELGATEFHVIYLDPEPHLIPRSAQPSTVDTMMRSYYMMIATKISEDISSARWINEGLQALRRHRNGSASVDDAESFARVAAKLLDRKEKPMQMLTIHRYFPSKSLGGELGFLNFELKQIARLIRDGEHVGLTHNCAQSGCLLDSHA